MAGNYAGQQGFTPAETETNYSFIPIPATVTPVAMNNPNRLSGTYINISNDIIYILFDQTVANGNGILLSPSGGSFSTSSWEDYGLTGLPMYAISVAGTGILAFIETQTNN